jgi:hypothetical protein
MQLQRDGVSDISIMADDRSSVLVPRLPAPGIAVGRVHRPMDVWFAADRKFGEYLENGAEVVVLMRLGAYAEFDLSDTLHMTARDLWTSGFLVQGTTPAPIIAPGRQ